MFNNNHDVNILDVILDEWKIALTLTLAFTSFLDMITNKNQRFVTYLYSTKDCSKVEGIRRSMSFNVKALHGWYDFDWKAFLLSIYFLIVPFLGKLNIVPPVIF